MMANCYVVLRRDDGARIRGCEACVLRRCGVSARDVREDAIASRPERLVVVVMHLHATSAPVPDVDRAARDLGGRADVWALLRYASTGRRVELPDATCRHISATLQLVTGPASAARRSANRSSPIPVGGNSQRAKRPSWTRFSRACRRFRKPASRSSASTPGSSRWTNRARRIPNSERTFAHSLNEPCRAAWRKTPADPSLHPRAATYHRSGTAAPRPVPTR